MSLLLFLEPFAAFAFAYTEAFLGSIVPDSVNMTVDMHLSLDSLASYVVDLDNASILDSLEPSENSNLGN